jgi:vitamin B12 transporter
MTKMWATFSLVFCLFIFSPIFLWAQTPDTSNTSLDTIVVTSSRTEESVRTVTTNITVISEQQIEASGATSLPDILRQQGFQVAGPSEDNQNLTIRGFKTETHGNDLGGHVIVLLNGRRLATGNLALMSLANIKRIEVIRGAASSQYGAAAMGGVVNLITRSGKGEPFHASIEVDKSNFNGLDGLVKFSGSVDAFDFTFGGGFKRHDDYDVGGKEKYFNTFSKSNGVNLNAGYTFLDTHRIGINFNYYHVKAGNNGYSFPNTATGNSVRENYLYGIEYSGSTPDEMFLWAASFDIGKDKRVYDYSNDPPVGYFDLDSTQGNAQLTFNHDYIELTGGVDYLSYDMKNRGNALDVKASKYSDLAFFLISKIKLLDEKIIFSIGGRYDSFKLDVPDINRNVKVDNFSPSIGIAYNPFDWLKLRANFAKSFAMPTATQLGANFIAYGTQYLGNPNLDPEKSDTYEFGFDIMNQYVDLSATYFTIKTKNFIGGYYNGALGAYTYRNLYKADRAGIELSAGANLGFLFSENFEFRPSLSYTVMTKYKGKNFSYSPETDLTGINAYMIAFNLFFNQPDIGLMGNVNYTKAGKRYVGSAGLTKPAYSTVNLMVKKRIWQFADAGHLDLKVQVDNLTDEFYDPYNPTNVRDNYPAPGRSFSVGLIYEY